MEIGLGAADPALGVSLLRALGRFVNAECLPTLSRLVFFPEISILDARVLLDNIVPFRCFVPNSRFPAR